MAVIKMEQTTRAVRRALRMETAAWQKAAVGLLALAVLGNVVLYGMYRHQENRAETWKEEAERTEQVKDAAVTAVGEMAGKVQDLEAQLALAPQPAAEPETADRYAPITAEEREMLARLVYLEAGSVSFECQQAVAEVVLNRVAAENFPGTVEAVINDTEYGVQFEPAVRIPDTTATEEQYRAVDAALSGENMTPMDVVYFSRTRENNRVWGVYDGVVFCYQYEWAVGQ